VTEDGEQDVFESHEGEAFACVKNEKGKLLSLVELVQGQGDEDAPMQKLFAGHVAGDGCQEGFAIGELAR